MGAASALGAGRAPRSLQRVALLLLTLLGAAAAAAAIAAVEGQCDAGKGDANCPGLPSQLGSAAAEQDDDASRPQPGNAPQALAEGDSQLETNGTGNKTRTLPHEELGSLRVGFVLSLLAFVTLWIAGTIKFAVDGSLPARLALWGLLPEAYAAISVRSVVALMRLKTATTPVIVLRNCVDDPGAAELAEAMLKHGRKAGLEALELPHNLAMTEAGLKHLCSAILAPEGAPPMQELDISYNPQLGDAAGDALLPLLKPKVCQVNTLRLADCGLSASFLQRFAEKASSSKLRLLDFSYNSFAGAGEALATLLEAPVLEDLTLACCGLRTADVEAIAENLPYTSLRSLHLGGNRFGGAGLAVLCEHLPRSHVDELGVEGNDLEYGDLSALGQAWAKRPFSRIKLHGNKMTQVEVSSFIQTLKSIQC